MTSKVDPTTDNRPREHVCPGRNALSVAWCTVGGRSEPAELEGASAMSVSVEAMSALSTEPSGNGSAPVNPSVATPASAGAAAQAPAPEPEVLRPHAEDAFAGELAALAAKDDRPRPARWKLSPWAVATYLLGGTLPDGTVISPKY